MTVLATDTNRYSNVIKWLAHPTQNYHFDVVTVNLAAGATLAFGTVLAKVTSTGKYLVQDASLATGAGLDNCVMLVGTDELNLGATFATTTDKKVLVLARGPAKVAKGKLTFGAGTDTDAEKLAVYNDLAAKGILVVDQL